MDAGGSGTVQVTGGLTALSLAWLLGPRLGKYSSNGLPTAIPAHNGVYVLFGCMLAWIGWVGLNSAGAILYAGLPAEKSVLVAPGYHAPAWLDAPQTAGELHQVSARVLGRDVEPAIWSPGEGSLPLLVAHDGPEYDELSDLTLR